MNRHPLSAKSVVMLCALAVVLFSLSALFAAREETGATIGPKAGPGAFSTSAIGYAAFHDLLERLGRRVARGNVFDSLGRNDIHIVAEPQSPDSVTPRLLRRGKVLLALPKWQGTPMPGRSGWVSEITPCLKSDAEAALSLLGVNGEVGLGSWTREWPVNSLGINPAGTGPLLLFRSDKVAPIVASEEGILLGETEWMGRKAWILSDPDVMSNQGIGKGDNASFMLALLDHMNSGDKKRVLVAFDETVHGYAETSASFLRLIFDFPFVIASAIALLCAALLAWAGAGRFGQPLRRDARAGFGKEKLIDNSARLMEFSGHEVAVLRRYVRLEVAKAAIAMHIPVPGDPDLDALASRLDRLGEARGVAPAGVRAVREAATAPADAKGRTRLLACARRIHRWRGEMLAPASRVAAKEKRRRNEG